MTARSSIVSSILLSKTKYLIDHSEEPMLHIIEVEHNYEANIHSVTFFGKDGDIMYEAINTEEHPEWVVNTLQRI